MKDLKKDILDALHDATNLNNGKVDIIYFEALLEGILSLKEDNREVNVPWIEYANKFLGRRPYQKI